MSNVKYLKMQSQENYCRICKTKCEQTLCKNCYVPLFSAIDHHISFAFEEDIPHEIDNSVLKDSIVIDCFKCGIVKAEINNFSQLRQLRLSNCKNLTKIELNNLPQLISLDAFNSPKLAYVSITDLPNLIAVDLSYCRKLAEIKADFTKVEYLTISHTSISKLPPLPSVKFLDISSTKIIDPSPLYTYEKLQKLIIQDNCSMNTIQMSQLLQNPSFSSIFSYPYLDFKGCSTKHTLKNIYCVITPKNIEGIDFSHTNYDDLNSFEKPHLSFEKPLFSGDWYESYRRIYGPYPTPPKDSRPFLSEADIESLYNIYPLPEGIDPKRTSHHIMGSLFGSALGDCLGMFCEGQDIPTINFFNDQPLDITWTHPITSQNGCHLHRGTFTDDTALMLTFIRAVVATAIENLPKSKDKVNFIFDPTQAATRIHHWIEHGIDEHLDGYGFGRGNFTTGVVESDGYDQNPIEKSRQKWESSGRKRASNGGVMRTAGCGCLFFWDESKVIEISRRFCQCTHYDPRCVFSSVLISLVISRLIQFRVGIVGGFDIDQTIEDVKTLFSPEGEKEREEIGLVLDDVDADTIKSFDEIDPFLYANEIEELRLEDKSVPRTINTMACAIWVLRKDFSYEDGIEKVIRAGGDTDTNAAVAGAVLGAKWGFGGIPLHILDFFWYGGILYRDATPFLSMMGLEFKPPTYEDIVQFKY